MDANCVIRSPEDLSVILRRHRLWVKKHWSEIQHVLSNKTAAPPSYAEDPLRADLHGATLILLNLFSHADLAGADFSGADLTEANLPDAILIGANLEGANLTAVNLPGADLTGAYLPDANLEGSHLWANLTGAHLFRDKLRAAELSGANLTGADLSNADLTWAQLDKTDLTNADLYRANLTEAFLHESNLSGTYLVEAKLWNAFFEPRVLPPMPSIARAEGLETLRWWNASKTFPINVNPYAILDLRKALHDAGYHAEEAKINLAYFRGTQSWWQKLLFDWTCAWGVDWARPIWIALALGVFCSVLYWILLRRELGRRLSAARGALALKEHKGRPRPRRHSQLFVIARRNGRERRWPVGRDFSPMPWFFLPRPRRRQWFVRLPLDLLLSIFSRLHWELPLFLTASLFSITNIVNLGIQGLDLGRWFRLLHTREFDLKARGTIRLLAGIQSVASFLLLGLSAYNLLVHPIGE